jgi:hypothetical protein
MFARMLRAALLSATILFTMASQAVDKETIHFNFNPAANHGENPNGGLLRDQAGNFYGAALSGTIFEMSPPSSAGSNYSGSQGWTYTVLCNCSGTYADGFLVMDAGGNLYGFRGAVDGHAALLLFRRQRQWAQPGYFGFGRESVRRVRSGWRK